MPSQRAPRFWEWRPSVGQWAAIAAAAIVLALVAWFAWQQGQLSGGFDSTVVDRERREARAQIDVLQRENARLNVQVAELEMARQLDREAYARSSARSATCRPSCRLRAGTWRSIAASSRRPTAFRACVSIGSRFHMPRVRGSSSWRSP
jgi:cell division protein FtsB